MILFSQQRLYLLLEAVLPQILDERGFHNLPLGDVLFFAKFGGQLGNQVVHVYGLGSDKSRHRISRKFSVFPNAGQQIIHLVSFFIQEAEEYSLKNRRIRSTHSSFRSSLVIETHLTFLMRKVSHEGRLIRRCGVFGAYTVNRKKPPDRFLDQMTPPLSFQMRKILQPDFSS